MKTIRFQELVKEDYKSLRENEIETPISPAYLIPRKNRKVRVIRPVEAEIVLASIYKHWGRTLDGLRNAALFELSYHLGVPILSIQKHISLRDLKSSDVDFVFPFKKSRTGNYTRKWNGVNGKTLFGKMLYTNLFLETAILDNTNDDDMPFSFCTAYPYSIIKAGVMRALRLQLLNKPKEITSGVFYRAFKAAHDNLVVRL